MEGRSKKKLTEGMFRSDQSIRYHRSSTVEDVQEMCAKEKGLIHDNQQFEFKRKIIGYKLNRLFRGEVESNPKAVTEVLEVGVVVPSEASDDNLESLRRRVIDIAKDKHPSKSRLRKLEQIRSKNKLSDESDASESENDDTKSASDDAEPMLFELEPDVVTAAPPCQPNENTRATEVNKNLDGLLEHSLFNARKLSTPMTHKLDQIKLKEGRGLSL